jgi:adenosylcobinamide-GDP ribazoletransferase
MFFTRIPVPANINHSSDMLQKSARYFSWVGIVVGLLSAAVFFLAQKIFSPPLSIVCSMLTSILVTGAFHEDGFADCCDGFGGGWTKEKILLIMKDSRLGTFGVIGLISILGLKFIVLQDLFKQLSALQVSIIMIAAHSFSRLMAVSIMQQYNYVQDIDTSKSKPLANRKLTMPELVIAIAGGVLPLFFLPLFFSIALFAAIISRWLAGNYFYKWIGGYTGDCLGATQQICELFFYIGIIVVIAVQSFLN